MKLRFSKMQASGNDFVVLEDRLLPRGKSFLARKLCDRKFGVGADGLLFFRGSKTADFRFSIYNSDGSHPKMCGNGARCVALWASRRLRKNKLFFLTDAGDAFAQVKGNRVKVKMPPARNFLKNLLLKTAMGTVTVHYAVVGVPHAVVFVKDAKKTDVDKLGRCIRRHRRFAPAGTNADFVSVLSRKKLSIRTYERGVEGETLSCGTGSVASVFVAGQLGYTDSSVTVVPASGEKLKIDIEKDGNYLSGDAETVFTGVIEI